ELFRRPMQAVRPAPSTAAHDPAPTGAVWFVRRAGPARRARGPAPRQRGTRRNDGCGRIASREPGSALERDRVEPPQEIPSLEMELVDVAVLVRDREVETRVLPGAVHPAGVDADDAV